MNTPSSTESIAALVIGVVLIAGIGLTGATLESVDQAGGPNETQIDDRDEGQTPGQGPIEGADELNGSVGSPSDSGPDEPLSRCVEPLNSMPGTLAVVVGFLAVVGFVFYRYNFSASLLIGWTILPPVALGYFLMTNCGGDDTTTSEGGTGVPGAGTALDISVNVPPWLLLGLAGILLVGAVGLMYRTMGEETFVTVEEEPDEDTDLDEFAEAAGRAADRIEEHDVDVDNAVYQAWVEMTDLIDVDDPDTYSPGEFAAVAVDIGMEESDVTELTRLFNEVRYGDRDATAREDRALTVLRNIESAYGDAADAPSDGSADATAEADDDGTDTDETNTTADDGPDEV